MTPLMATRQAPMQPVQGNMMPASRPAVQPPAPTTSPNSPFAMIAAARARQAQMNQAQPAPVQLGGGTMTPYGYQPPQPSPAATQPPGKAPPQFQAPTQPAAQWGRSWPPQGNPPPQAQPAWRRPAQPMPMNTGLAAGWNQQQSMAPPFLRRLRQGVSNPGMNGPAYGPAQPAPVDMSARGTNPTSQMNLAPNWMRRLGGNGGG